MRTKDTILVEKKSKSKILFINSFSINVSKRNTKITTPKYPIVLGTYPFLKSLLVTGLFSFLALAIPKAVSKIVDRPTTSSNPPTGAKNKYKLFNMLLSVIFIVILLQVFHNTQDTEYSMFQPINYYLLRMYAQHHQA